VFGIPAGNPDLAQFVVLSIAGSGHVSIFYPPAFFAALRILLPVRRDERQITAVAPRPASVMMTKIAETQTISACKQAK
jgi:hypothetical protein